MAKVTGAMSVRKAEAYDALRDAAALGGHDSAGVEGLRTRVVRSLIGEKSKGLTATSIRNMRRKLAAELRAAEMRAVADGILAGVQKDYPDAEAKLLRGRRIEIHLDGLPEEAA